MNAKSDFVVFNGRGTYDLDNTFVGFKGTFCRVLESMKDRSDGQDNLPAEAEELSYDGSRYHHHVLQLFCDIHSLKVCHLKRFYSHRSRHLDVENERNIDT
jgi:hypothetical protein